MTTITSTDRPTASGPRALFGLAGWIVLCFVAAAIGAAFRPGAWYAAIEKPTWTPPNDVFGPVWTLLYFMMATAAFLVWRRRGLRDRALALFGLQLALNALWSWLFFGLHRPGLALLDIVLLWGVVLATLGAFRRIVPLAAALLVPYQLWLSYALALNAAIWWLSR